MPVPKYLLLGEIYSQGLKENRFLAHLNPKGQVSYCHHLASVVVVRRPSYVVNFFKNLLL